MTTSDKLREFGQKVMREYGRWWGVEAKDADKFVSDLTALISEGYVEKAKYDEAVRQRDELREAVNSLLFITTGKGEPCGDLNWDAAEKRAITVLKSIGK